MRTPFVLASAFVVLTSTIGCGSTTPNPGGPTVEDPTTLTLSGRVVDAAMGDEVGVADAFVTANRNGISSSASTDADGNFAISGLEAGEYTLFVNREGYLEMSWTVQLDSNQSVTAYLERESDGTLPARKGRLVMRKK